MMLIWSLLSKYQLDVKFPHAALTQLTYRRNQVKPDIHCVSTFAVIAIVAVLFWQ